MHALPSTPHPSITYASLQTSKQHTQSTQSQNHRTQSKTLSSSASTGCHSRRRRSVIPSCSCVVDHCTASAHGRRSGDRGGTISGNGSAGRDRRNRGCGCGGRGSGFGCRGCGASCWGGGGLRTDLGSDCQGLCCELLVPFFYLVQDKIKTYWLDRLHCTEP
jgi:hypothetical protein